MGVNKSDMVPCSQGTSNPDSRAGTGLKDFFIQRFPKYPPKIINILYNVNSCFLVARRRNCVPWLN